MKKKSRLLAAMTAAAALTITVAGAANAANIGDSSGPLTKIEISEDLNCDVEYLGDAKPEFYAGNACGTLVARSWPLRAFYTGPKTSLSAQILG